tara:strand:+ start:2708 stop:3259 length:552 start_codon:yes stop_codon:yes gene_type:complete
MRAFTSGVFTTMIAYCSAFKSPNKPTVNSFNYQGDIKPVGYFDPANIASSLSEKDLKYVREAELQHGRVAMMAFIGLVGLDLFQDDLAINYLYKMNWEEQFPYWFGVGCYEFARMGAGWKNPFIGRNTLFKLEDNYQPGNLLKLPDKSYSEERLNRELSNGRLAMLGTLGYMAEELLKQHQIV